MLIVAICRRWSVINKSLVIFFIQRIILAFIRTEESFSISKVL